jgi:hypothetical protein
MIYEILSCKNMSRLVSQAQDRSLTKRERFDKWVHLSICKACRQFEAQLRLIRMTMKQQSKVAEEDESVKLSDSARAAILEKLHQQ